MLIKSVVEIDYLVNVTNIFPTAISPIWFCQNIQSLKLSCDSRFQRAFTACSCVFKVITLVWSKQRNFFENVATCSKRMRKTLVATQLNLQKYWEAKQNTLTKNYDWQLKSNCKNGLDIDLNILLSLMVLKTLKAIF